MCKYSVRIAGLFLIVALTVIVTSQRQLIAKLRAQVQSQGEQSEGISRLIAENARLTVLAAQDAPTEARSTEPTKELLRLRGEVARLHREYADADELSREIEILRQENRLLSGPTANDSYFFGGLDTNSLPEIAMGAPREKVSAELHRVGAKILSETDTFVQAQAFPAIVRRSNSSFAFPPIVRSSNSSFATIKMEFWFEEGRLTTRRDSPSDPK